MANTYVDLRTTIQQDLKSRGDLDAIIKTTVTQRVNFFQNEPFGSQENTDTSINTVAGTASYTLPTTIMEVTGAWYLYAGNTWLPLKKRDIEYINTVDNIVPATQSPPTDYAIYQGQLRLFPVPSGAWNVKLQVIQKIAAPVLDADSNFWTKDAYDLIRYATVEVMASQYIQDEELALRAGELKRRELNMLLTRATILSATGQIKPHWY